METLKNEKVFVEYRESEKEIFARDLTDQYNEPAMYTKSKRGLAKAWEAVKAQFNESTTMSGVLHILWDKNIKTHSWCMMD